MKDLPMGDPFLFSKDNEQYIEPKIQFVTANF